jgi:hypothetical protein
VATGSKQIAVTQWDTLEFVWTAYSTSVDTHIITWSLKLKSTAYGRIDSSVSKNWSVTIDGQEYSGTNTIGISNNSSKKLASGTTTVKRAVGAAREFAYSFSQEFAITFDGEYIGTISGSGHGVVEEVYEASQPSCITWPEHTQNVGEFGDEISIHMNRKSNSYTHTVRYAFGEQTGTIATGVTTGCKWVIPLSLMNLIPNTTKASGTIFVDTYRNSSITGNTTFVGTKYCGFTATVPASVKPTCTLTVSDPTGNLTTYGAYVKGLSKFQVTVTPTIAYKSAIKAYSTNANGSKYTGASFTTGVLKSHGTLAVSTTVTDGRGRTASASKNLTVLDYALPSVTKVTVGRCDADGTANEQGDHVQVTFSATVTALNNKNTATYVLKYKKTTKSTFTEVPISAIQNNYAVTNHKYIFAADTGNSYDVEVSVADNHGTATRTTSASTAFTLMHFGADGTSIGLLKVAERSKALDIGGDTYLNGHALFGAHGMFDNREDNENPQWYMETYGRGDVWEFKELTAIGFTSPSAKYAPVQTIIPWKDSSGGLPKQITYESGTRWIRIASSTTAWGAWRYDALAAYPVGSIYIAYNHTNPGTLFGGTWERLTGGFLWASQSGDIIGQTGGEREHTLSVNELPSHNHGGTYTNAGTATKTHAWLASGGTPAMTYEAVNSGGGQAHNNMPPYIQVSIWRRTA